MDKQSLILRQKQSLSLRQKQSLSASLFMDKNTVLISAATLFREVQGKLQWFLTKQSQDGDWEFPKVIVRKGESSVRAILRIMGEKGGMTTRVLEESGRTNVVNKSENKTVNQKYIYYLMLFKTGSKESPGFGQHLWLEYPKALKKLDLKKEKNMLKLAREVLKEWKRKRQSKRSAK